MRPTAIIGDIHGALDQLQCILQEPELIHRRIIFLGDYINRGPDSRGVLSTLIDYESTRGRDEVFFLRGNHEELLLRWLLDGDRDPFIRAGGLSSVRSYTDGRSAGALDRFVADFPPSHLRFLRDTRVYFEDRYLLASHTGIDSRDPAARTLDAMVLGRRHAYSPDWAVPHYEVPDEKLVIFGHYVQESLVPRMAGSLVCIDTGCGTLSHGKLTALLLPELRVVQS